jgi:hypothetical protein
MIDLAVILMILALVVFLFAAFDRGRWSVNLTALGLAFLAASMLAGVL